VETLDRHCKTKHVQSNLSTPSTGVLQFYQKKKKKFKNTWSSGHKNRVKRVVEVKLRNFRGQGDGLGNKRIFISRKMVEALEKLR